jgi:hypothetical protein
MVVKKVNEQTWFETSTATIPWQWCQKACWYLSMHIEKSVSTQIPM